MYRLADEKLHDEYSSVPMQEFIYGGWPCCFFSIKFLAVCRSYTNCLLILSICSRVSLLLPVISLMVGAEQSRIHWVRSVGLFVIVSLTLVLNSFVRVWTRRIMCFCRTCCSDKHCVRKCSLSSSGPRLHRVQVGLTKCWLNLCLFACKVYVPVSTRALTTASLTCRGFVSIEDHNWCGFEMGSSCIE